MDTMQAAWTELTDRLRAYVRRRVRDAHAAEDITQDVLLKIHASAHERPPEDKLPAWIFSTARNTIIDYYRSAALRRHEQVVDHPVEEAEDRAAAIAELAPCLRRMADLLPEPYREALRLADFDGVEQQAIAERMGLSLSGAKSRVQRARQLLREMIQDCCHVERDRRGSVIEYHTTQRSLAYCGGGSAGTPGCRSEKFEILRPSHGPSVPEGEGWTRRSAGTLTGAGP